MKRGNLAGLFVICLLLLSALGLSGCISNNDSKDNGKKSGSEAKSIFLPPEGRSESVKEDGSWMITKYDYDSLGYVETSYTIFNSTVTYDGEYGYYHKTNITGFSALIGAGFLPNPYSSGSQNDHASHCYPKKRIDTYIIDKPDKNPVSDTKGLDFYPPEVRTEFRHHSSIYYINDYYEYRYLTNISSISKISIKNYGDKSLVFAKTGITHLSYDLLEKIFIVAQTDSPTPEEDYDIIWRDEFMDFLTGNFTTDQNRTLQNWTTTEISIVFEMESNEVVELWAFHPYYLKREFFGEGSTGISLNPFKRDVDLWEVRYAQEGDTNYGNMTVIRNSEV